MTDNKFPSEVIDLPSGGKVYPEDSPLRSDKLEIKYNYQDLRKIGRDLARTLIIDNLAENF